MRPSLKTPQGRHTIIDDSPQRELAIEEDALRGTVNFLFGSSGTVAILPHKEKDTSDED